MKSTLVQDTIPTSLPLRLPSSGNPLQKYLELQILLPREAAAFQELVHILGENVVNELSSDGRIACGKGIALSTYGCRPTTPNYHLPELIRHICHVRNSTKYVYISAPF